MLFVHVCFMFVATPDVLAFLNFAVENVGPLPENASEHTRAATITVSLSPHTFLVGEPVVLNSNPVVHPFMLSRRSAHQWDLLTTGVPKLNFEMVALYSLVIYAQDNRGATASQTILIQVADVNEPPTFIGSLAQGDQDEKHLGKSKVIEFSSDFQNCNWRHSAVDTRVLDVHASVVTIVYTIPRTPLLARCTASLAKWQKQVWLSPSGTHGSYSAQCFQSLEVTEIYILEDTAPGTVIYRATAKDPEDTILEYSLSPEGRGFTIDHTGTVSTAAGFDFESGTRSFSLVIQVVDPEGLFTAGNLKIFLINVNNKDPILTCSLFSIENSVLSVTTINSTLPTKVDITLDEEIPIGKTIGVCQATDEDELGDVIFELDPGNVYFTVGRESGTVVTATHLDKERSGFASVQSFSIKACDSDQRCAVIPVIAYVRGINDNSPFCDQYLIRYTEKEVIAKGTVVAELSCHDLDEPPDTIHYAPLSGLIGPGQLFDQVSDAEHVIQVTKELDYENPEVAAVGHIYEMMISVFDDLRPSHAVTVTVIVAVAPVNEFRPVFEAAHYSFSVPETSGACHKVGRVTAIDEDYPPNCLTYTITGGDSQDGQRFWIHPRSGEIELTTQPDYESVKQYNLTVEAVDCDKERPRTAGTVVTVDIENENDEAPACTPSLYKGVIFDNVVAGTNVNGFQLSCHDRDSQDFEMRFEMASGNENHHFGFDPTRGSNTPRLIVKNPFHFESGADLQRQYHLVVHIIDDNLKYGKSTRPRTGTAIIDIYVKRGNMPPHPTSAEQREGVTVVSTAINSYKPDDWYNSFVFTLMAISFVGLVSWVCFLLWRYRNTMGCCQKMATEVSRPMLREIKYIAGDLNQKEKTVTGNRSKKLEVLTETTMYETVFDGEAIDPVSGRVYEYNSRTGARKWKRPQVPGGASASTRPQPPSGLGDSQP